MPIRKLNLTPEQQRQALQRADEGKQHWARWTCPDTTPQRICACGDHLADDDRSKCKTCEMIDAREGAEETK